MAFQHIVGSDVILRRLTEKNQVTVWQTIKRINNQLALNPIKKDESIDVVLDYTLDATTLEQLQDVYRSRGWDRIDPYFDNISDEVYPRTVITFHSRACSG